MSWAKRARATEELGLWYGHLQFGDTNRLRFMRTVLIADDLAAQRQLVRITLSLQGWNVLEAETGYRAIELAKASAPDAVLLDVVFGDNGLDGFAVCEALKADPVTARIPVVMLTARNTTGER